MKVIKEGKNMDDVMRVTCKICEAELEIEAEDIKKHDGDGGPLSHDEYFYECPCCNQRNYVEFLKLPDIMRSNVLKRTSNFRRYQF